PNVSPPDVIEGWPPAETGGASPCGSARRAGSEGDLHERLRPDDSERNAQLGEDRHQVTDEEVRVTVRHRDRRLLPIPEDRLSPVGDVSGSLRDGLGLHDRQTPQAGNRQRSWAAVVEPDTLLTGQLDA